MERRGLRIGAALMRRWFRGAAFIIPVEWKIGASQDIDHRRIGPNYIDSKIVSMQWAMQYERTTAKMVELRSAIEGSSTSQSLEFSKRELLARLQKNSKINSYPTRFGEEQSVIQLHECSHVNARAVAQNGLQKLMDPLDDLYCALGAFTLHAAAKGDIQPLPAKQGQPTHRVCVRSLGFYIRDSYDFSGDQPLGNWSSDGVRMLPVAGHFMVENQSFRAWRDQNHSGGDFLIFSDVHWMQLAQPLVWDLSAS